MVCIEPVISKKAFQFENKSPDSAGISQTLKPKHQFPTSHTPNSQLSPHSQPKNHANPNPFDPSNPTCPHCSNHSYLNEISHFRNSRGHAVGRDLRAGRAALTQVPRDRQVLPV